jgi:hypothetical protein
MGFIVNKQIETLNGDILNSFYVRVEMFSYDRPSRLISVTIAHYESLESSVNAFPKLVIDENLNDMTGQIPAKMKIDGRWKDWDMCRHFSLLKMIDVDEDVYETKWEETTVDYTDFDDDGNPIILQHQIFEEVRVKTGVVTKSYPMLTLDDMSTGNIFEYAYELIKSEYISIFSEELIINEI